MPLAGDASNRRYYRLHLSGVPVTSLILMQLADPEGFKASEEAVSGQESEISELPFINVLQHLRAVDSPVPILYFYDEPAGLLFLQDFGDVTLARACHGALVDAVERWYRQAIDVLVQLHVQASVPSKVPCLALSRSFDVPLVRIIGQYETSKCIVITCNRSCSYFFHASTLPSILKYV